MSAREEVINFADRGWINAMDRPGAYQVGYLRKLIESRPQLKRVPDSTLIVGDKGVKALHMEAFRGADNSYAMIYMPVSRPITVNTAFMKTKEITASWFNPQNAVVQKIGTMPRENAMTFIPPVLGAGNDWVLIIDDPAYQYTFPAVSKR